MSDDSVLAALARAAWKTRENAYIFGKTRVGCAVLSDDGRTFVGCNVEHKFRCHDVHAEVNAITSMVSGGGLRLGAIVIVAERERFTPCGACLDWIFQFAAEGCVVAFQGNPEGPIVSWSPTELMPYYPE